MITLGTRKNLLMGAWVLAALILLGVHGLSLMAVFDPTLLGRSSEVRLASQKWQQLEAIHAQTLRLRADGVAFDAAIYVRPPDPPKPEPEPAASETVAPAERALPEPVTLPELSGIVRQRDVRGAERFHAFVQGRRLSEKDTVAGFTIHKIDARGITLTRESNHWFIPAPDVHISIDRQNTRNASPAAGGVPEPETVEAEASPNRDATHQTGELR